MKTWFTKILGVSAAALVLFSCDKDEDRVTLTPNNTPTISASTNNVVLAQGNNRQTALTYTWTPVSGFTWNGTANTYEPGVTYTIQLDKQGNNFAAPVSIDAGSGPTTALSVGTLNTALNSLGLVAGTATPLETRLKAMYASNAAVYSSVVALTATAFVCKAPNANMWSIIGDAGVNWDTDITLVYDCDLRAYTITRALKIGEFKFRLNKDWTTNYGSVTARDADGTAPLDTRDGNNIKITEAGTYTIALDLDNMKYTLTK